MRAKQTVPEGGRFVPVTPGLQRVSRGRREKLGTPAKQRQVTVRVSDVSGEMVTRWRCHWRWKWGFLNTKGECTGLELKVWSFGFVTRIHGPRMVVEK